MKNQMNKKTLQSGILILVSMLFYLYFAWHDGVVICEDSPTYINMNIMVFDDHSHGLLSVMPVCCKKGIHVFQ